MNPVTPHFAAMSSTNKDAFFYDCYKCVVVLLIITVIYVFINLYIYH